MASTSPVSTLPSTNYNTVSTTTTTFSLAAASGMDMHSTAAINTTSTPALENANIAPTTNNSVPIFSENASITMQSLVNIATTTPLVTTPSTVNVNTSSTLSSTVATTTTSTCTTANSNSSSSVSTTLVTTLQTGMSLAAQNSNSSSSASTSTVATVHPNMSPTSHSNSSSVSASTTAATAHVSVSSTAQTSNSSSSASTTAATAHTNMSLTAQSKNSSSSASTTTAATAHVTMSSTAKNSNSSSSASTTTAATTLNSMSSTAQSNNSSLLAFTTTAATTHVNISSTAQNSNSSSSTTTITAATAHTSASLTTCNTTSSSSANPVASTTSQVHSTPGHTVNVSHTSSAVCNNVSSVLNTTSVITNTTSQAQTLTTGNSGTGSTMSTSVQTTNKDILVSQEETNFLRLTSLVLKISPRAVRTLFDFYITPSNLSHTLSREKVKLQALKQKRVINEEQWNILYPPAGSVTSVDFDLTLMVLLLRSLTAIPTPSTGWNDLPKSHDQSEGADLARIKYYRNKIAHATKCNINNYDFTIAWQDLNQAIVRIGGQGLTVEVSGLLTAALDQSYKELYRELQNIKISEIIPPNIQYLQNIKFDVWTEESKTFVATRLTEQVKSSVEDHDFIVVSGPPGSGKSTTIHNVALLLKEKGYRLCHVQSAEKIIEYWIPECKQVFVLDDPFGVHDVDDTKVNQWRDCRDTLNSCFQFSSMKVLAAVRTHVAQDERTRRMLSLFNHLSVSTMDAETSLTDDERKQIFSKHASFHNRQDLLDEDIGIEQYTISCFPLLCRIFTAERDSSHHVDDFFKRPFSVIQEEIQQFETNDPLRYFCLLFCMIYDGELDTKILDLGNECQKTKERRETFLELCTLPNSLSRIKIKSQLDSLINTYLTKEGETYHFIHGIIHDSVVRYVGQFSTDRFKIILKYASGKFLKERIRLNRILCQDSNSPPVPDAYGITDFEASLRTQGWQTEGNQTTADVLTLSENYNKSYIILGEDLEPLWCDRMLRVIEDGQWDDAFTNKDLVAEKGDEIFAGFIENMSLCRLEESVCKELLMVNNKNTETTLQIIHKLSTHIKYNHKLIQKLQNQTPFTSFHVFVFQGLKHCVKSIFKSLSPQTIGRVNSCIHTLVVAVVAERVDILELLIGEPPCNINQCDFDDLTPLYVSALHKEATCMKLLLEKGAHVNKCNKYGASPLHEAAAYGREEQVRLLLEQGANVNKCNKYGESPLFESSRSGHRVIVELLLDRYANVNKCADNGWSPLYASSRFGHLEVVKLLIEAGANIDRCNKRKQSPLYAATRFGHESVVKTLIERGADLNKYDYYDESPVYVATRNEQYDILKLLIESGANLNKCNKDNMTALYLAEVKHKERLQKLLLESGAARYAITERIGFNCSIL